MIFEWQRSCRAPSGAATPGTGGLVCDVGRLHGARKRLAVTVAAATAGYWIGRQCSRKWSTCCRLWLGPDIFRRAYPDSPELKP